MDQQTFLDLISNGIGTGALVLFVWGLHKEWWVMGATHRRIHRENERLWHLIGTNTQLLSKAVDIALRPEESE